MAYLQAKMKGTPTYIMLPKEMWTDQMWSMRCQVFRLERALYGHKNSGVYWQQFCHAQCAAAGFEPIGQNWPSVYFSKKSRLLLIVYVDDMKLSGPKDAMPQAWADLGRNILLEEPRGNQEGVHTFLGCTHSKKTRHYVKMGDQYGEEAGTEGTLESMEYDVTGAMAKAVAKYEAVSYTHLTLPTILRV